MLYFFNIHDYKQIFCHVSYNNIDLRHSLLTDIAQILLTQEMRYRNRHDADKNGNKKTNK